ncbi:hypothetical protein [Geotalea sp. SG265]|uniref:hypothetical protein n=1 Tax=Geotalea sp. SG265 TaxID=2922867 RepID=UPI001FB03865|nr:hypothetical protein [Geotalea sp. SG265]
MRKRIMTSGSSETKIEYDWLDLARMAQVEVTSEDDSHPIEGALIPGIGSGWRAATQGKQTIRLLFDEPQKIRRLRLRFRCDFGGGHTQEFMLSWSPGGGQAGREIVRQQFNFSPPDVTTEVEDYVVDLDGVAMLELTIMPDISGGETRAALEQLRVA